MKQNDRNLTDDLLRSKLYDLEVEVEPEVWEAIASRLPGRKKPFAFRRAIPYWSAAAVVFLLVLAGAIHLWEKEALPSSIARTTEQNENKIESLPEKQAAVTVLKEKKDDRMIAFSTAPSRKKKLPEALTSLPVNKKQTTKKDKSLREISDPVISDSLVDFDIQPNKTNEATGPSVAPTRSRQSLMADATSPVNVGRSVKKARKWSFGMGGGSFALGANNSTGGYAVQSMSVSNELHKMNAVVYDGEAPKTAIHHKTPIGIGLSVSYNLNERFALQTGLNYSFVSSKWTTNGKYSGESKQKLHFIGVPLSLTYKIAEWKRLMFYASAGAMAEVNVAGKLYTSVYAEDREKIIRLNEHVRMKEWYWSVNARVGVSYPVIRFVSLFAEVGASYYFDNGSAIETIHSDKPFNVSPQVGFRFGF